MQIPIDNIKILRVYLRRSLDQEQLRLLAEDMQRHGQIQPIAVRRTGTGAWELIAGRRRLEAAKLIGWTQIEAHELEWQGRPELPAAAENIKRSNLTPLEEADLVHHLSTQANMSMREIAEQTGHGISWVQDRLQVANWPSYMKDALHARKLTISTCEILLRIEDEEYRKYLVHCGIVNGCTIHQAEAWWLDWQARQKLIAVEGWDGKIPQPQALPPPLQHKCYFCNNLLDSNEMVLLRVCRPCHTEMHAEKQRLDYEQSQKGNGEKDPSTDPI